MFVAISFDGLERDSGIPRWRRICTSRGGFGLCRTRKGTNNAVRLAFLLARAGWCIATSEKGLFFNLDVAFLNVALLRSRTW